MSKVAAPIAPRQFGRGIQFANAGKVLGEMNLLLEEFQLAPRAYAQSGVTIEHRRRP
jgi:hypothetical protein